MITLCGQILVSRKLAIRDDPNIRLRCKTNVLKHLFYRTGPQMYGTGTTRTCFNTCARCADTHGDVLNGHTEFFSVSHHTTTPHTPHRRHTTTQDTTPHGDRQRLTETEGEEGTKEKTTRQEQREERRVKRDRENSFSAWWCMAVLS